MTASSDILPEPRAGTDVAPLRAKWGWIVAPGVVYVVAGFVALGSAVMATVASVLIVGVMQGASQIKLTAGGGVSSPFSHA